MPTIKDYQLYAETAFAAYAAQLGIGNGNVDFYKRAGMADLQAQKFDSSWQVLGQQELSDGFSAVLFQRVDSQGE